MHDVAVFSWALDRRADVTLFAPRGTDRDAPLPLVVLLHGVFGSHWSWARSGLAHHVLQDLVDAGEVRPVLLAMPSDGLVGIGSGYATRPGADAETWVAEEVPAAARLLHPRAGEGGLAVAGLSMGGWGALRLAARRPGAYRAASGMSPLTRWDQVAGYATGRHRAEHATPVEDPDLAGLLVAHRDRLPPLRITCGTADALLPDVRGLRRRLLAAGVGHEYAESAGGHEWRVWERELRATLVFLDRCW
nr:alpha/beta hydrolase-fold protein [Kineococcus siccus]